MENKAEGAVKTGHFRRAAVERAVFCLTVFFSMLVFFAVLHPIPIMDEDDVLYTVLSRPAIPIPGYWNPSRMMPEVCRALSICSCREPGSAPPSMSTSLMG